MDVPPVPSAPKSPAPQQRTPWLADWTQATCSPVTIRRAPVHGFEVGGAYVRHTPPLPIAPYSLSPQQRTLALPDSTTQTCTEPAATCATPVITSVIGGTDRLDVLPIPSCPCMLFPQQRTPDVEDMSTHVDITPSATAEIPVSVSEAGGTFTLAQHANPS